MRQSERVSRNPLPGVPGGCGAEDAASISCRKGRGSGRTPRAKARAFLREETQFHLGFLPTEQSHPRTRGLSRVLHEDPARGLRMLLSVDDDIPPVARRVFSSPAFAALRRAVREALDNGRRIYFSGCGSTGRLAILLDAAHRRFWRKGLARHPELRAECGDLADRTRAVMTGGDFALVRSVEMFEDFIPFGVHQAERAGISEGDLLVAISEGGETSSVIGTIRRGLDVHARVFFLFNNPADLLSEKLARCRVILRNPAVTPLELCTGPMAVAGSTRMQATTIELLVAGAAFEAGLYDHLKSRLAPDRLARIYAGFPLPGDNPAATLDLFESLLRALRGGENVSSLARLAELEAGIYERGGRITYFADRYLLDIFTDTTERSPTFRIPPFRRGDDARSPAPWAFVKHPCCPTSEAWKRILEREPCCLDWTAETYRRLGAPASLRADPPRIDRRALESFRIGNEPDLSRTEAHPNLAMTVRGGDEVVSPGALRAASGPFDSRATLAIGPNADSLREEALFHVAVALPASPLDLSAHLAIKLVLNTVSTATMGRLGRLESNWMTHVEASNKKLIDRSTRLVSELAGVDYETACLALFETMAEMESWDESRRKTTSPAARTVKKLTARIPGGSAPEANP